MMAMNLLGAICRGLLEYNSMYFSFQSLYILAIGCYAFAFLSDLIFIRKELRDSKEEIPGQEAKTFGEVL